MLVHCSLTGGNSLRQHSDQREGLCMGYKLASCYWHGQADPFIKCYDRNHGICDQD